MIRGWSPRPLAALGILAGLSFFLLREEPPEVPPPGPSAEIRSIELDRFSNGGRIHLSAARAVFSPDGVLRLERPRLRASRAGGDLFLESQAGEMAAEYDRLVLRGIRGELGLVPPLRFRGERMEYGVETGKLSGGAANFERAGQRFSAGSFTYSPDEGAKFSNGVRGSFAPAAANRPADASRPPPSAPTPERRREE